MLLCRPHAQPLASHQGPWCSKTLIRVHDAVQCSAQVVAGVWHGLFPGYALFFVTSAFMFESAKVIYRYEQVPACISWCSVHTPPFKIHSLQSI